MPVSETGELMYPHRKYKEGKCLVGTVLGHPSKFLGLESSHSRGGEHLNFSETLHHFVGKLAMAEILLTDGQHHAHQCPDKHLLK